MINDSKGVWKRSFWTGGFENGLGDEVRIRKVGASQWLLIAALSLPHRQRNGTYLCLLTLEGRTLQSRLDGTIQIIPAPRALDRDEAAEALAIARVAIESCSRLCLSIPDS